MSPETLKEFQAMPPEVQAIIAEEFIAAKMAGQKPKRKPANAWGKKTNLTQMGTSQAKAVQMILDGRNKHSEINVGKRTASVLERLISRGALVASSEDGEIVYRVTDRGRRELKGATQ